MRGPVRLDRWMRSLVVLSRARAVAGAGLAGLGLVLLAATAGFRAGLRRARPEA